MRLMSDEQTTPEEGSQSKSDPLSGATRALKRNLLLVSLVAVTFKAFKIKVEHISVAGVNMDFDRGVFEFLILVSLVYFLLTFSLYYYIDIRNVRKTDHQVRTDAWQKTRIKEFIFKYWKQTNAMGQQPKRPPHTEITINKKYMHLLERIAEKTSYPTTLDTLQELGAVPPQTEDRIDYLSIATISPAGIRNIIMEDRGGQVESERREAILKVERIAVRRSEEFSKKYRRFKARLLPRIATVHAAYIIRNYGTDGLLPILFALVVLAVLYNFFDVSQLPNVLPQDARQH